MDSNGVMKYRTKIIESGKKVGFENHDTGLRRPQNVSKERQEELFMSFIDWYGIFPTGTTLINYYIQKNYSQSEYQRVLCVGDGEWCHLGRKLASKGYDVIDPTSNKEFEIHSNDKHGSLHVENKAFYSRQQI